MDSGLQARETVNTMRGGGDNGGWSHRRRAAVRHSNVAVRQDRRRSYIIESSRRDLARVNRRRVCRPIWKLDPDLQRRATRRPAVTDLERALHGWPADPEQKGLSKARPPIAD